MALTINLEEHYNHIQLEVIGGVDSGNARIMAMALADAVTGSGKHLLLECSQLHSLNSDGLRVLLTTREQMSHTRAMVFCNPASAIFRLLSLSGISRVMPVLADSAEARALFQDLDFYQGYIPVAEPVDTCLNEAANKQLGAF